MTRGIVTGSASGIGREIARHLHASGYALGLVDRNADGLAELAAELAGSGPAPVTTVTADVRSVGRLRDVVDEVVITLGGLDALVNNAGVRHVAPIEEVSEESWREEMDVKVTGAFFLTQAAVPHLRRSGGGAIVNVASISGLMGYANRAGYCAANAALMGLTRQNAVELAPAGIRVNAVAPGFIETPMTEYAGETVRVMERMVPLGRRGTSDDVARAVAFLCGEDSAYITGATLNVTGGVSDGFVIDAAPWANRYEGPDLLAE